ncbi:MAG: YjcQ family protein [Firmicutes bacterium]|nr:YjcQ family protein [Bacillota bacterium]
MGTLEIAYKILYSLEHKKKADYMGQLISPQKLGCGVDDWVRTLEALLDEGYIAGVTVFTDILGQRRVDVSKCRITMKGAEYLQENSTMRKFAQIASDVITIVKP